MQKTVVTYSGKNLGLEVCITFLRLLVNWMQKFCISSTQTAATQFCIILHSRSNRSQRRYDTHYSPYSSMRLLTIQSWHLLLLFKCLQCQLSYSSIGPAIQYTSCLSLPSLQRLTVLDQLLITLRNFESIVFDSFKSCFQSCFARHMKV